jgi:hypothetical protein
MFEPKTVAKFAGVTLAVYAVLTWAWHWSAFSHGYARYFQGIGNVAFSQFWFWPEARVRFYDATSKSLADRVNRDLGTTGVEPPGAQGERDTTMLFTNRNAPGSIGFFRTASRITGYAPTAVMVALALGTPVVFRRRMWLLGWGLVLVHGFILFRLTVIVLHHGFAAPDKGYALFQPGSFVSDFLKRAAVVIGDDPTFSYLVSVLLWGLMLFGFSIKNAWSKRRRATAAAGMGRSGGTGKAGREGRRTKRR